MYESFTTLPITLLNIFMRTYCFCNKQFIQHIAIVLSSVVQIKALGHDYWRSLLLNL